MPAMSEDPGKPVIYLLLVFLACVAVKACAGG